MGRGSYTLRVRHWLQSVCFVSLRLSETSQCGTAGLVDSRRLMQANCTQISATDARTRPPFRCAVLRHTNPSFCVKRLQLCDAAAAGQHYASSRQIRRHVVDATTPCHDCTSRACASDADPTDYMKIYGIAECITWQRQTDREREREIDS